ncbi:MAG: hypothetical protein KJ950_02185 [Proteobacteria bacterium]|nr:hypothetical protein [Pseudomonadota bacterium]MBU1687796.1 hypothetical protein [Pseudomonadota bacterium]
MLARDKRIIGLLVMGLVLFCFVGSVLAETKLDYRQREAVKRQEWNMNDIDKKMAAGASGQDAEWLLKKLDGILADLDKNNCPDDNSQVAALKGRVATARGALSSVSIPPPPAAVPPPATPSPVAAAPASAPVAAAPASATVAEVKLGYPQREAVKRQESNRLDIEQKITKGEIDLSTNPGWVASKLEGMLYDLDSNQVPTEGNSQAVALRSWIAKMQQTLAEAGNSQAAAQAAAKAAAPPPAEQATAPAVPKLPYGAKQAVDRQWNKVQQGVANFKALREEVTQAAVIKKWDDYNLAFSLSGVQSDLDKNSVPPDHPYYKKIMDTRASILNGLEELKAVAQPKIDAYQNATNESSYPDLKDDMEKADNLAHMYNNVGLANLNNPAKAEKLLGQADQVEKFISDSRKKYAPLIEAQTAGGRSLNTDLIWLEKNFTSFKKIRDQFNNQTPGAIKQLLSQADGMMAKAKERKNPQIFTGGVAQAMGQAEGLLTSLTLSLGKDAPAVLESTKLLATSRKKSEETAKALEEEILAETKAPADQFKGSGRSSLIKQMEKAWEKNNPKDKILEVRIVSEDWEQSVGWEWNNAYDRWEKYDRQTLNMVVIVKTDGKIATIFPAFINRDNMKKKEWEVAQHDTKYVVRRMLVKNL